MKNKSIPLILFAVAASLSGCISVKTQHKIEPISITVDINVKTDRALDNLFGDLYSTPTESK